MSEIPWTILWQAPGETCLRVQQVLAGPDFPEDTTHALIEDYYLGERLGKDKKVLWICDPDEKLEAPDGTFLRVLAAFRGCHAKNMKLTNWPSLQA